MYVVYVILRVQPRFWSELGLFFVIATSAFSTLLIWIFAEEAKTAVAERRRDQGE